MQIRDSSSSQLRTLRHALIQCAGEQSLHTQLVIGMQTSLLGTVTDKLDCLLTIAGQVGRPAAQ